MNKIILNEVNTGRILLKEEATNVYLVVESEPDRIVLEEFGVLRFGDITSSYLNDLLDVNIDNALNGQTIIYDDNTKLWNNKDADWISDISNESIGDLSDVTLAGILPQQVLAWDGVRFRPVNNEGGGGPSPAVGGNPFDFGTIIIPNVTNYFFGTVTAPAGFNDFGSIV